MRLWILSMVVLGILFCTVRLPAQTTGGTSQVSPVANLQGSNASVVNNNFQYLQNGLNAALYEIQQYFPGGILQGNMGGTGLNSTNVASGDTLVSSNGIWTVTPLSEIPTNVQVFTVSGTWTKPANVSTVYVKLWGGGGGGDGNALTNGGGGSGGYTEGTVAVTENVTVTVGAAGAGGDESATAGTASSFVGSTTLTANGGGAAFSSTAGTGGSATSTSGALNLAGLNGVTGSAGTTYAHASSGADALFGVGKGGMTGASSSPTAAQGYSAGGGGALGNVDGGNGTGGLVIVYY